MRAINFIFLAKEIFWRFYSKGVASPESAFKDNVLSIEGRNTGYREIRNTVSQMRSPSFPPSCISSCSYEAMLLAQPIYQISENLFSFTDGSESDLHFFLLYFKAHYYNKGLQKLKWIHSSGFKILSHISMLSSKPCFCYLLGK
jgi:hypothetical protein